MIKTKTEAVTFLVFHGTPQNLAKVSVNEAYAGAPEGSDLLYGWDITGEREAVPEPVEMSLAGIRYMHDIVMDSVEFVKGGIAVEGVLKYNMNGDLL